MKKLFYLLAICLVSFQLDAQSKQEKITELIGIMHLEQAADKMFDNMLNVMKQQSTNELTKDQQNELMSFMMEEIKGMMKTALTNDYPSIYDKYLTEKDVDELIRFYKSPIGQKFVKVSPDIQKEYMTTIMSKYIPEIQKKMAQKKKEIKNNI